MATFKKRLKHTDPKRAKYSNFLNSLSMHLFSGIVDEHKELFLCSKCNEVPEEVCYISSICQHTFCESCIRAKPFFVTCPRCGKEHSEKNFVTDPRYWAFYECYKRQQQYIGAPGKALTVDYVNGIKKESRLNFLLQEECRRLFNQVPTSPVKNSVAMVENIKLLLNSGANPNVLNKDGWTLMHEAVDFGQVEVLQLLLVNGGLVDAYRVDKCSTCLHDAIDDEESVNYAVVSCLLAYGADMEARDLRGLTSLEKARAKDIDLQKWDEDIEKVKDVPIRLKPEEPALLYGVLLPPTKQKLLNEFCHKFKLKQCVTGQKFSKEVTHIIVNKDPCEPNLPVLLGILNGCFIVTSKWIESSLAQGYILPPAEFEVTGTRDYPNTGVPRKARENAELLRPRLFAGGQFNILDGLEQRMSSGEKETLVDLITAGGGKVLTRATSCTESIGKSFLYHAHGGPLQYCTVVVLQKTEPPVENFEAIRHFPIKWLHRVVQTFKIEP